MYTSRDASCSRPIILLASLHDMQWAIALRSWTSDRKDRQMSGQSFDAVVIGSGLGGMSAGAYLGAAGERVASLERHSVIGGSSLVFRRRGRWPFDAGGHWLADCV